MLGLVLVVASGCANVDLIAYLLGQGQPPLFPDLAISVVQPDTNRNVSPGASALIQWADIASVPGTFVTVRVDRLNSATREKISEIVLVPARDALADGVADRFEWDVTGVIVGTYKAVLTIAAPDGRMQTTSAPGDFNVTSTIPAPTLTFTNPAAADVNVPNPGNVNITWTDNGVANGQTRITLTLDPTPDDPANGDERTIARNLSAADNGNNGTFNFDRTDADGVPVPPGTYTLRATLVDDLHDDDGAPIVVNAIGRIVVEP